MKQIFSILIILTCMASCNSKKTGIVYPETPKEDVTDYYFDIPVQDPYRWLENDRSEATENWVKSQNEVTFEYLSKIPFREELRKRLNDLTNYPKYGSPFKKHGVYYFFKNDGLQNQSILYRQQTLDSEPEVLLDPNELSQDGTVALSRISFSKDGKYLAYSISKSGSDWNEIYVMNIQTKELLDDHVQWVKFSGINWYKNGFYYSAYDAPEAGKEYSNKNEYHKIYYHTLGQPQSRDELIYQNQDFPLRNYDAYVTDDDKYLFIYEKESSSRNALLMKDLSKRRSQFVELAPGFDNDYDVIDHINGKLYIFTNWGAPKGRIMQVDPANAAQENWVEIIPETDNVLKSISVAGEKLIAVYMQDVASHAYAYTLEGEKLYEINLPGLGTISGFSGNKNESEAFYTFTSFTFPPTIYRFDVDYNKSEVFRKSEVAFTPEDYVSEQIFYTGKDGTRIPMFITYKKGMVKSGENPVMLYGYGGFNHSRVPGFNAMHIPFLENGGIYAVANIRGGGEYGEAWHKAGTKLQKQNVFNDFIAAAEYLIDEKYTNEKKLAINGGSNGGLLVGACMTQRPDLFAVAVPEVGVLDMLRYHKFTIGWAWATDYGTSEDSKEMFTYLKAYSPLHNVFEGIKYPATLVTTADHDDRVVPAHSFKFAATLQAANDGTYPALIRIDTNAGHGAGRPIHKIIDAQTDVWSFVMYNLGMTPTFNNGSK
ncbi:S9 family peptidase [Paludibacter sp. 221]|uniref:prolyl oligopeptidase family serine peptidase n=1 Tax=Paludibacter sp. 221 TaxID=2302939 RepID=UPI0013D4F7EC|nr:prolyl oligopeptidase family serine peptidase [Paludibacter sp. 221]NDV45840.1 S9 family peptidase [Paludibacter sp. 221]